jgi:hypothetical protein
MKPLTKEQLRDNAAAMLAFADGKPIQFNPSANDDPDPDSIWWDTKDLTYIQTIWHRPKPQPVARPWSKPEDVPLNCWLRPHGGGIMYLITNLSQEGTWGHTLGRIRWSDMPRFEYSTDRVTWKPCTVEE